MGGWWDTFINVFETLLNKFSMIISFIRFIAIQHNEKKYYNRTVIVLGLLAIKLCLYLVKMTLYT